jgi:hypothetical protein
MIIGAVIVGLLVVILTPDFGPVSLFGDQIRDETGALNFWSLLAHLATALLLFAIPTAHVA